MALPTLTHDTTDCGVWHGHPLFSLENIYRAYRRCRRRKRGTCNALLFEQDLEENLLALHEVLNSGAYAPGRSIAFLVKKPKQREIFAAILGTAYLIILRAGFLFSQYAGGQLFKS
jgi:hypothetical protein